MNIADYLIDQEGKDWNEFMSDWGFALPEPFTIWLVNRFGDIVAVFDDGSVHFLDVGTGVIERIADSCEHFISLVDQDNNARGWFLIDLVDQCVAAGFVLNDNQCYSFKVPPILGGQYSVQNVAVTDLAVHYSFMADICRQAKDLPNGTKVRIVVGPKPAPSTH